MRCFTAIDINPQIKKNLSKIQEKLPKRGIKTVSPKNMHLTVNFLGKRTKKKVKEITKNMEKVKFQLFETYITGLGAFPSKDYIKVIWAGIRPTKELTSLVKDINKSIGFKRDKKFHAHITLARAKTKSPKTKEIISNNKDTLFGKLVVDKFSLKKSTLTSSGPIYENLAVFPATED